MQAERWSDYPACFICAFHRCHRTARFLYRRFRASRKAAIGKIGAARTPQLAATKRPKPTNGTIEHPATPLSALAIKKEGDIHRIGCAKFSLLRHRAAKASQARAIFSLLYRRAAHSAQPVCAPKHLCAFSQVRDACFLETPLPRSSFCLARCSKREVLKLKGDVWRAGWYKGENFARGLAPLTFSRYKGENFAQRPAGTARRDNLHLRDAASPQPQKASRTHGERSAGSHTAHRTPHTARLARSCFYAPREQSSIHVLPSLEQRQTA